LEWLNGVYIRAMTVEALADAVQPFLPEPVERAHLLRMLPLVQERMKKLNEVGALTEFLRDDPDPQGLPFATAIKRQPRSTIADALTALTAAWERTGQPSAEQWDASVRELAERLGWKAGDLFMALRIAITGSNASPPTYEFAQVLGWPATLRRLHAAIAALRTEA
jgi:glutamyl-tRNA synthetase